MVFPRLLTVVSLLSCTTLACGPAESPPRAPTPPPSTTATAPAPAASTTAAASTAAPTPPPPEQTADAKPPADLGREACKKGDEHGCDLLAEYWGGRWLVPVGKAEILEADAKILKNACDVAKLGAACFGYALMRRYGTAGGPRSEASANDYSERAEKLGDLFGFRHDSADGKVALARAVTECEGGWARSCSRAAFAALNGVQRDKDVREAFAAYRRSCKLGSAMGCRWAGHIARTDDGLRDLAESERLLTRACEGGYPSGCDELGTLMASVRKDEARALELHERACDDGNPAGCAHGAELLLARKERARGLARLRRSCDGLDPQGCRTLGELLETGGEGLKKDRKAAYVVYTHACKGSDGKGCEGATRVAGIKPKDACQADLGINLDREAYGELREACRETRHPSCVGILACDN